MDRAALERTATMPLEEYIRLKQESLHRHEFVNGQLIEMPETKDINNAVAGLFCMFFMMQLKQKGYQVYMNDVKVGLPDRSKYY